MSEAVMRRFALTELAGTEALAGRVAGLAVTGDVLALSGPLGAGKTAFARGFIQGLGVPEEVPSPSFTLVQSYRTPDGREIAHFDLYRLESPDDLWELGWEDALLNAITLLEWPERLGPGLLPADRLDLALLPTGEETRQITALGHGSWGRRLAGLRD